MRLTGTSALVVMLINLVLLVWFVYFIVKCAAHVGAWPFA